MVRALDDLTDWRYEGIIYRAKSDPNYSEKLNAIYAPDVVQGNDGRFYLYYNLSGDDGFNAPISVAVCDTPVGEYEYYGVVRNQDGSVYHRTLSGDPAVINDSGVIRLYFGWALPIDKPRNKEEEELILNVMSSVFKWSKERILAEPMGIMGANTVELADDMVTITSKLHRVVPPQMDAKNTSFEGHAFFEASSIRKIDDTYYFIYSSQNYHELCYATSKYPDRDFEYRGVIISNGDVGYQGREAKDRLNFTGNNHGSIVRVKDKWYIFYHRHTNLTNFSRQACAEEIEILPDGSIPQVEITSCGLNGGPLKAEGEYSAYYACNLTNGNMPHFEVPKEAKGKTPYMTCKNGERFITDIQSGTDIGYKYFDMQNVSRISVKIRGKGEGVFQIGTTFQGNDVGTITVEPHENWKEVFAEACVPNGTAPLYFHYEGNGSIELLSIVLIKVEEEEAKSIKV